MADSALGLSEAKEYLSITGNTHDAVLQDVIDSAESAIKERVGPLAPETTTVRVEGCGTDTLVLDVMPAIALTSVTPATGSALTIGDLHLDTEAGLITWNSTGGCFTARYYDVVYTAGRSPVPNDLLMAIKEMVRHLWEPKRGPSRRPGSDDDPASDAPFFIPHRVAEMLIPHIQTGFA